MDVLTKEQRSYCMSQIQGKNTKPELMLRKYLWNLGIRYRLHYNLPGKPDIVLIKNRIAVFVDGCFWHGCEAHGVTPKTNSKFWDTKIKENLQRDIRNSALLEDQGWTVLRFWEHDIKSSLPKIYKSIQQVVHNNK
jgi:DNA mismatch endonuclease (patch repair protein)